MESSTFNDLRRGDVVRHRRSEKSYIVQRNFGPHVIATDAVDMSNPEEWNLILKATHNRVNQVPEQDNKSRNLDFSFVLGKKTTQDFLRLDERITLLSKQIDTIAGNVDVKINRKIDKLNRRMDTIDDGGLDEFKNAFESLQNCVDKIETWRRIK